MSRHLRLVAPLAVAAHLPRVQRLATASGQWVTYGKPRCWRCIGAGVTGVPAVAYTGERVSIAGRHPGRVLLRGVSPGFSELDTIDAHTHAILAELASDHTLHLGISRVHRRSAIRAAGPGCPLPARCAENVVQALAAARARNAASSRPTVSVTVSRWSGESSPSSAA